MTWFPVAIACAFLVHGALAFVPRSVRSAVRPSLKMAVVDPGYPVVLLFCRLNILECCDVFTDTDGWHCASDAVVVLVMFLVLYHPIPPAIFHSYLRLNTCDV